MVDDDELVGLKVVKSVIRVDLQICGEAPHLWNPPYVKHIATKGRMVCLAQKYPTTGFMSDGFGIGWNVVRLFHKLPLLAPFFLSSNGKWEYLWGLRCTVRKKV